METNKELNFELICPKIVSKNTFDILKKYNCFEEIQKIIDEHGLYPCDFFDLTCFFRNVEVVRIIKGSQEIIISDEKPNLMLFIDNNFISFKDSDKKLQNYITKYDLKGYDYLMEVYAASKEDFVLLLKKTYSENEYDEVRELLKDYYKDIMKEAE